MIFRKIIIHVAALCLATFASMPEQTGLTGIRNWIPDEQTQLQGKAPVSATIWKSSSDLPLAGRTAIEVDSADGIIYFGKPTTKYTRSTPNSLSVGVPFLDLGAGFLVPDNGSKLQFRKYNDSLMVSFVDYKFSGYGTANLRISAQVLFENRRTSSGGHSGLIPFRVNWHLTKDVDQPVLVTQANIKLFDGIAELPGVSYEWLLGNALRGQDLHLMRNGRIPSDSITGFTTFPRPLTATEVDATPAYWRFDLGTSVGGCDVSSPSHGCGFGVQANWISGLGPEGVPTQPPPLWGEFSGVDISYHAFGDPRDKWKIWFFEEGAAHSDSFLPTDLSPNQGLEFQRISFSASAYVSNAKSVFRVDSMAQVPVDRFKVLAAYVAEGGYIDVSDVVLRREHPPSLRFYGLPEQSGPPAQGSLTVRVLATTQANPTVRLMQGANMVRTDTANSAGEVAWTGIAAGDYTVVVSKEGYSYQPEAIAWNSTSTTNLVLVQQSQNKPVFAPNPPQAVVLDEGQELVLQLKNLAMDPRGASYPLSWSIASTTGSPIPYKLDPVLKTLRIGSGASDVAGTANLQLVATGVSGATASAWLAVTVRPVNDAPRILATDWSVAAGALLAVNLDSIRSGKSVWVHDPDDSYLALTWTANLVQGAPEGATVSITDRKLFFQAPADFSGSVVIDLSCSDLSDSRTTRQVTINVVPPQVEIYGITTEQLQTGDLKASFFSRYSLEPVSLQNSVIKLLNPSNGVWGTVPARLIVVQAPGYRDGRWMDGAYEVVVDRSANWTFERSTMPLTTLARGLSSLTAKLPLAADGKSQDKEAVFRSLDLNGPLAVVTATAIDTQALGAGVRVEWKWLEPGTAKTVKLSLTKGDARHERVVQIPAGATSVDVPWADPSWPLAPTDRNLPYLRDGQEYRVELIGVDEKGNPGGGSALVTVPSSGYELRITTMNLFDVPSPKGQICIEGRSGWKSCALYNSYGGDQLMTTRIMEVKRDVYRVVLEDDRYQPEILDVMPGSRILGTSVFEHSPDYPLYDQWVDSAPDMKLFLHRRNFLAQDGASLEQEINTGDLVFRFERNRFTGGMLDTILLGLTEIVDGVPRPVDIRIPVTEYNEFNTPSDLDSWTVRRTLEQLRTGAGTSLFSGASYRAIRYLGAAARFWNMNKFPLMQKTHASLRDSVVYHPSGVPTAWHVLDPDGPSVVDDSRRSITSGGEAGWALDVPSSHGARAVMTLCRQDDDGTEVCRDSSVVPTVRRLGFRPTVAGAYSVPGNVNFQEGVAGGSVFVPAGQASAASQWNLFSDAAGEYDLWVDWSTDDFSEDFAASLDSGKNWVLQNSLTIEGWNRIGTLDLRKGWNALAIRASQGAVINGVLLQKIGTKKPILLSSTLALSHAPIPSYVSASLDRDRIYKSTLKVRDAYGLVSQTVSTFPVQPDGLFGDIVLEQEPITGDLLIKAGQTRFVPTPGGFQIRLSPGTPAIVPELDSSDRLTIRIPRAKMGPDVLAGSGVSKAGPLDSIRILTTKPVTYHWTTRHCWHGGVLGSWGCDTRHHQETRIEPDSIRLNWTGFVPWKSAHDLRPLPKPVVSVAYAGLDSIRLKIAGLDDSSGQTRQTMAGTVRVEWTPGSHCASATTVEVPFRQVFVLDETGSVLLRPSLSSASASRNGGWADTTPGAPRLRHQWLDNTNGGGFFPMMLEPIPQPQDRPWIAFAIRNPQANPFVAKLWTLPGDYVGLRRQRFDFRLAPMGTTDPAVPAWKSGQGYSDVWHGQTDDLILQPGLQELQIRMVDPGVTFRAIGLREASLGSPSVDFNSIPRTGSEGMNEVFVSAPALASGTLHGFRIVATDRVGNTSTDSVTVATLASNTKLPTVGIALSPWDGSGWVTGDVATVSLIPDGRFALPEDAQIKAWLRHRDGATGALTSDSSEVAVVRDANGDWTATLSGLGARGQTLDDFENGDRTVLVAWVQTATDRGNRTGLDFAVLSDTRPGLVTGTFLDGPVGSGLTFRVKEAWQKQPGSTTYYADLELPAFKVQEDDTAVNHLVLRGAKVAFATEGASLRLTNVVGGRLAATHCKLVGTTESQCHDVARMPWTLGRWAGFLEMESVKPEISGTSDWRLEVQNAELIDDAGRPSRNSEPFYLADAGIVVSDEPAYLGKANFSKDRFWFANVVAANQQEEAFGIEACMTVIRRSAFGLEFETMGCDTETGPFLTFPLNIQTDGPWSVVGAAFDSLKDPYKLTWTPGTGSGTKWIEGVPESRGAISIPSAPVTVTKSALRDARGASLWGYDVLSYKFGQTGVTDLVFDLVLPDTKLSPAQDGVAQRVKSFTGMSIVSDATVMQGAPVLRGTGVSTDPVQLRLGSSLRLDDVVSWTYARQEGVGWVLTPYAGASAPVYLSKEQDAGWKYTRIGGLDQADDRFRFPFETLEIGPGTYVSASSSQDVVVSTGGATVTARLAVDPNDDELRIVANSPSVTLDKFFTEKGTANFASATVADPELRMDPEFGMADIEGVGNLGTSEQAANKQVWIGGLPVVNAIPSGRFQILANRGRVFVRLFRPQMVLHDLVSGALPSAPSAEVQTAVFTTDRMPVAVGAQLDVPDNWKEFQIPGSIGSLQLDKMYLEATSDYDTESKIWTPGLRLQTPTVVKLGDAFQKMGLDGYRLPLKSVTMGLRAKLGGAFTSNMKMDDLDWDVEFETAPIGFALDLELTRERLRTLVSGSYDKDTDKTPVLVKLSTQGWPVYAKYQQSNLELSLQNWEIELTDSFPIQAMRNTSFHLENLTVQTGSGDFVKSFRASGTKEFPDDLAITSDVVLKGLKDPATGLTSRAVKVTLGNDQGSAKEPYFELEADSIKIGDKTYNLACNGVASSILLSLGGDIKGDVCVEIADSLAIYPFRSDRAPDVWATGVKDEENLDPKARKKIQLLISIKDGEFGIKLQNARLRSIPLNPVFEDGVDVELTASIFVKDGSIRLREASVLAPLGTTADPGWKKTYGPFGIEVPELRFYYNTPGFKDEIAFAIDPKVSMKAGKCDGGGSGLVQFKAPIEDMTKVAFDWDFTLKDFFCDVSGLELLVQNLNVGQNQDELTLAAGVIQVSVPSKPAGLLGDGQTADASKQAPIVQSTNPELADKTHSGKGFRIVNLNYDGSRTDHPLTIDSLKPIGFGDLDNLALEIPGIGVTVISRLDVMPLFDLDRPGVAFDNVRLALPKAMGGDTLNTNFSLLFNGKSPYVHVRGSMKELPLRIRGIQLTDDVGLNGAEMLIKFTEKLNGESGWSFEGTASLNMQGGLGKLDAELAVEKPGDCKVGVCKAVVSLRLKDGARYPLGTTGLYMAGLKGAFYDGIYSPPCAKKCTGREMPNGMKVELAIYLEAESPSVLKGTTGVWVQLNRINFGVYGDLLIMEGRADADACAAVFAGGKQFHGEVNVRLQAALSVKGGFVIDIWSDRRGKNMAAEASASVGLERGAIIKSRWFKFPRSMRWFGPFVTRFGRFDDGSNGVTTGIRALGKTWGAGFVNGGFRLGNVGKYKLAKPPSEGGLVLAGSEYRIIPLGLDLQGGEVVSVNVGAAEGVDWRGAQIQLLESNTVGDEWSGYTINDKELTPIAGMDDRTVALREDSANIHSLTWINANRDQRVLVAIPNKAGTGPTGEVREGAKVASSVDDLQVFLGLVDPTVALTAAKCADDTTEVCISGSVVDFRKDVIERTRTFLPHEVKLFDSDASDADKSAQTVLKQKHNLKFWAIPVWDTTGSVGARDSAIPLEIASYELDLSGCIADLPTGQRGVSLNGCRWKPKQWKTGRYQLMAGVEGLDYLPQLQDPNLPAEPFLLDQTRRILTKPGESEPFSIAVSYPHPVAAPTDLAAYGSALDSAQSRESDQRRTLFARWTPQGHPDVVGHMVRWTDAKNAEHLFHAGVDGTWNWVVPHDTSYKATKQWDSTLTRGGILGESPAYDWMFAPPAKLEVAPALYLRAPGTDSFYWEPRWDLAATWTGPDMLGRPAGGTANLLSVATAPAPLAVELNQTTSRDLTVQIGNYDPVSGLIPASLYGHLDMELLDANGQPLSPAARKAAPSVVAGSQTWKIESNELKIPFFATALANAALCRSRLATKDGEMVTDTTVCKDGDTLKPATALGDYVVRLRLWSESRLEPGKETIVTVPVKVTPPRARIDRVGPDYLLAQRTQKIRLEASNLWVDPSGRKPVVAIKDGQGQWVDFAPNGSGPRGTEQVLEPDSLGRVDTELVVQLDNEYAVPDQDNFLTLHVFHRDTQGQTWGTQEQLTYVDNTELIACQGGNIDELVTNNILAMDFVGFYPKTIGLTDTVTAIFSEIHNPDYVNFKMQVKRGNDSVLVPLVDKDAGGVRFMLPKQLGNQDLGPNEQVTLKLNIPDTSAGTNCKDRDWTQTLTTTKALEGTNVPRQLKATQDPEGVLVRLPADVPSDARIEWVRGTPPEGWAWNWIQGNPTNADIPQTDWLNVRIRRPEAGVVWQDRWLVVTPPRQIELAAPQGVLRRRDTLAVATALRWSLTPKATQGRNGTSLPVAQCRWNNNVWETCSSRNLVVDLVQQGTLELRVGWKLFTPAGDTTVWEPVQSWQLVARSAAQDGIVRVPLRVDGQRLAHAITGTVANSVLRVRRTGTQLPRWDATAPVVRDAAGHVLPQETEVWDPVAQRYEAWVQVPELAPHRALDLELWLGDLAAAPAPAITAWHGSASAPGVVGAALAAPGQTQTVALPGSDARGWSASLWARFNPDADETLWNSSTLQWGTRTDGRIWLRYRGDSVVSAPGTLDEQGPMLLGATWEIPSGRVNLWANGQMVVSGMVAPQDQHQEPTTQVVVGGRYGVDELRWGTPRHDDWKLRWESERPGSGLWDSWTQTAPSRPRVLETRGAVGDTLALVSGAPVWADREARVTAVPSAWNGAAWMPGLAHRAQEAGPNAAWIRTERFAKVCAVGDIAWEPAAGWTREATNLATTLGARAVWCHPLPTEATGLPGAQNAQVVSGTALSWFLLAGTAPQASQPVQPGQSLSGWTLPDPLPSSLAGAAVPGSQPGPDGLVVPVRQGGGKLVLVTPAHYIPGTGTVLDTVWVRDGQGNLVKVLVVWTDSDPGWDSALVLNAPMRAVVPRDPSSSLVVHVDRDSIRQPGGSRPNWSLPVPQVGPRSCDERVFSANYRRPAELWLALGPNARTDALQGWQAAGEAFLDGQTWTQWTRKIEPGRFTWDANLVFPIDSCATFLWAAVERWRDLPDWKLSWLRSSAVGGVPVMQGGLHQIKNLEIEHAAALSLRSQQYSMKLLSATGTGRELVSAVLGLGSQRVEPRLDAATGLAEYVDVAGQFTLHDLRADLLDADSVHVDLRNLRASGTARLTVMQRGRARFAGGIYAVLFRDRDGDLRFTEGSDERIGMELVREIGPGQSVKLDFVLNQSARRFPEEVFVAWLDAAQVSPERVVGDHVALGGNPCRESKAMRWLDATTGRTLADGTPVALAHLRDTDGDGRVRDRDSLDRLWYAQGKICRSLGEGDAVWCTTAPGAGSVSDLAVRDLTGDGLPEIIAGDAVLRQDGSVLWDLRNLTGTVLTDLDADGRTDTIRGDGTCRAVVSATGDVLWSDGPGCSVQGRHAKVAWIASHPDQCADVSVSGIHSLQGTTIVRVANAGTVVLPAGLVVARTNASGGVERLRAVLDRKLDPGEFVDLEMGPEQPSDDRILVLPESLREGGIWEWNTNNNAGNVGGEMRP